MEWAEILWKLLTYWLLFINIASFVLMAVDKYKAKHGLWRISEKMLFLPVLLGGGVGGVLGMKVFHHKTRHWYFKYGFPVLLVLWTALVLWLAWLTWA